MEDLARRFPDLELRGVLGRGGMGAVYLARQVKLDRDVALKVLPPEVGRDPAFAQRFLREARTLARLNHPHIVQVFDFGQTPALSPEDGGEDEPGLFYFLMEYVDGANLRDVIAASPSPGSPSPIGGALTPAKSLEIVRQVCAALQFAHARGVVHRDVKPENILLDKTGTVKIVDFGLAKLGRGDREEAAAGTLTGTRQAMGTPHYMAPEQARGTRDVDHRADIYSLGVVFYELLTGELPLGRFAPAQRAGADGRSAGRGRAAGLGERPRRPLPVRHRRAGGRRFARPAERPRDPRHRRPGGRPAPRLPRFAVTRFAVAARRRAVVVGQRAGDGEPGGPVGGPGAAAGTARRLGAEPRRGPRRNGRRRRVGGGRRGDVRGPVAAVPAGELGAG